MESKKLRLNSDGVNAYNREIENKEEELKKLRLYKGTDAIYQGDNWHDNPTLYQAELKEVSLMKEISRLKNMLLDAEIVESLNDESLVDIGDVVKLEMFLDPDNVEENIFKLVATTPNFSANIKEVSLNSPLGSAIYQKKVGESTSYSVNNNTFNIIIKGKAKDADFQNEKDRRIR